MKLKFSSLRFRMLMPVIAMTLFVVVLLTVLFSRAYTSMILQQEQDENAAGFELVSRAVTPLIDSSIAEAQSIMADSRVASYARLQYSTAAQLVHARISCRDYLRGELSRQDGIFGLLFMRKDGSLFGVLPEFNFFLDDPQKNPFSEEMMSQILNVPLGQTVWVGPISGAALYGFENAATPQSIMIAAWKSVDVHYGEVYALMLMDDSIFERLLSTLQDGRSTWHLFTADHMEIFHSGEEACTEPERMISESNSGSVFRNDKGEAVSAFSMTMTSPDWTLVREVSMEDSTQVVSRVRSVVFITAVLVFLIALRLYRSWLKRFMLQFNTLLSGIKSMGQGNLEPISSGPFSIGEFETMHQEIDRTSHALNEQMDTIRRMERERMEQENKLKEQERLVEDLHTAREIQRSALPHIFPPFPERKEIELFASMDPALDVGGDFYDFFFIDEDHLCLVMADVSGKGIPGALFMMVSKRIIQDTARADLGAGEILEKTNAALCDNNQTGMFVTVWLGILELSTGRLTAANAGHEYPVIQKKGGSFELYKDRHGFVIGGMESARYRDYELQMEPGDKIFVYTDGVPEATAGSGEMFGTERMVAALNTCREGGPEELLQTVSDAVDAFVGDAEQFDDLTMMCLEYRGLQQQETEAG
ncbi:MAG: PP2C family protein-serine/threonine phosphatase [Oscillospiraceae bacterium]|nr:PP2C family protein-serine/threonine phosphatase [Oscillospiraceae bacterium]